MSALLDAWNAAKAGGSAVVLIEGPSGCGLTRLCDELVSRLNDEAVVLHGRGTGSSTAYETAASVFEAIKSADGSAGAAPEALAEVARLVPGLKSEFKFLPAPTGDEVSLRDALAATLAAIGEEQPVLVVLDDGHAADEPTRRLFASLASRLTGRVLMVLAGDASQRGSSQALSTLLATRGLRHLRLGELALADVEAMLGSMLTLDPTDRHALAARLHEESAGNPHDVHALVTALVDEQLVTLDSTGIWRSSSALSGRPLPIPAVVRARVRARLDRASPAARGLSGAIAVLGAPANVTVAESVAELSADEAETALGELVAGRMVREVPNQARHYEFSSPLVARVVAALLPPTKRESLHARAAQVLSERDLASTAERSLLPYHLARAQRPDADPKLESAPAGRRKWLFAAIPVAAAAVAVAAFAFRGDQSFRFETREPAVPVIALGRIADYREGATSSLTKPLIDMLATNLGRVGNLRVVSAARMYELVSQAGQPGDTTEAALVSAARRAGATELVDGALYARDDGGFRLDLRRVELATGNIRKTHSVTGRTLFELADSGTARVATDFGESIPDGSIAEVTTRSMSAYRLYEQGLRLFYANDLQAAEPLFEAAFKEDSTFAMAAYYSAQCVIGNPIIKRKRFATAARLAKRTTDRERLTILAQYAFLESQPSLVALADTLIIRYPDEVEGYLYKGLALVARGNFLEALTPLNRAVAMDSLALGGSRAECDACDALRQIISAYQGADSLPAAEREARRWIRLQPRSSVAWSVLGDVLSQSGRSAEALTAVDRQSTLEGGQREALRLPNIAVHLMLAGDYEQAGRLLAGELESRSPFRLSLALWYGGINFRYQGRLNDALDAAKRYRAIGAERYPPGIAAARRAAPPDAFAEAQVLFEMGRYRASAALFDSVARFETGDESPSQSAHSRAWAMTHASGAMITGGDTVGVAARIETIRTLGEQSLHGRDWLLHHHVRGMLLGARGQDEEAVAEFRRAVVSWNFGYTRTNLEIAKALMRLGRPREAVKALQPALRGAVEASNFYVSRTDVHELLGQAWAMVGDAAARDSAIAHYDFVAKAWSRADSSFAERRRKAVSEAARLRSE
jgi:tetratricopeptide (TPR) repeat protein